MSGGSAHVLELAALWRNPAFVRFRRSRLRLRRAIFWYLLTAIVTTFVVTVTFLAQTNMGGVSSERAARELFLPLLIIQGVILLLKGTGAVSAGLIQDKLDLTLDYQRLTPMTPLHNVLGYLFGLPVLEYAMVGLTLPHLVFVVAVGNIPLATVATVYTAFLTCAVLYHLTGIAAGMVMRRWVLGYILTIVLVILVNVLLPLVVSQLGLRFFQYLSVWPVIGEKVLPLTAIGDFNGLNGFQPAPSSENAFFATIFSDVPFYDWQLSPFVFTLLLQGSLILTLGVMAVRRWQSATRHSLSKPYALAFLTGFVVLAIGNVWPAITGKGMPFSFFGACRVIGESPAAVECLEQLGALIALGLPLVYSLVVWALCLVLFSIVIPSHQSYMRGIRRAHKQGRAAARPWENDAAALWFLSLFVAVALAGIAVLYREITGAGFLDEFTGNANLWRLPLALGLVLSYSALTLLVFEMRKTVLIVLLTWFLPILAAIVIAVAAEDVGTLQSAIAALSPITYLVTSSVMLVRDHPGYLSETPAEVVDPTVTAANVGLVVIVAQVAFLLLRWRMLDARLQRQSSVKGAPSATAVATDSGTRFGGTRYAAEDASA